MKTVLTYFHKSTRLLTTTTLRRKKPSFSVPCVASTLHSSREATHPLRSFTKFEVPNQKLIQFNQRNGSLFFEYQLPHGFKKYLFIIQLMQHNFICPPIYRIRPTGKHK